MSWHILVLGNAFLFALTILAMRAIAREKHTSHPSFVINAGFNCFFYITALCFVPFLQPLEHDKAWHYLPWFIGGGIGFALANVSTYKLLTYLDAGISSVLSTIGVLFTILFASLILGENLNSSQAIGSGILILSVSYMLFIARQHSKHHKVSNPWLWGLLFAILAGIFVGISLVNEKYLIGHMNLSTYLVFGWGGQTITALVLALIIQPKGFKVFAKPHIASLTIFGGVARGLAGLLFLLAQIKSNNIALVTVVTQFRLVFIVILAAWLLKERQKLKEKLIASGTAIAGMSIIFWK